MAGQGTSRRGGGWCLPPLSALLPVADYNVLSQPTNLLVIILNVTVNTIPVLAFRMIHGIVVKLRLKVRQSWRTSQPLPAPPSYHKHCVWGQWVGIPDDSQCPQGPNPEHRVYLRMLLDTWGLWEGGIWFQNSLGKMESSPLSIHGLAMCWGTTAQSPKRMTPGHSMERPQRHSGDKGHSVGLPPGKTSQTGESEVGSGVLADKGCRGGR